MGQEGMQICLAGGFATLDDGLALRDFLADGRFFRRKLLSAACEEPITAVEVNEVLGDLPRQKSPDRQVLQ